MWLILLLTAPLELKKVLAQGPLPAPGANAGSSADSESMSPFWSANVSAINNFFADAFNTDVVIESDLWDESPKMLSAGSAFWT